jgi:peptidoglycan hydrolase-like protein with peptidoglycan-binding domain
MYRRILVALWLIGAVAVAARAQNDPGAAPGTAPGTAPGVPPSIAALQDELRQAGFDPGPANGVMTEQTTRALIAYERRMRRMPQTIASVGVDAADPVMRVQQGLKRLGLYSGRADGNLGPATRDAIIRFEVSRQLPVDPRVSDSLLAALAEQAPGTSNAAAAPATAPSAPGPDAQGTAPASAPPAASSQVATGAANPPAPEATGRQALPNWVNPPPIR